MKTTMIFPILGLVALMAPKTMFAEPDTGPVGNTAYTLDNSSSSASADLIMPEQEWVFEISNTYNFKGFTQANGQETGVHRSDHSVVTTHYILKNSCLDSKKLVNGSNYGLDRSDHERSCSGYIIDSNSWKCNTLNASENQKFNVIGAASMAAMYTGQMVWVHKRPAWPIRPSRL